LSASLIIGPSQAGKTALLATLAHAALNQEEEVDRPNVHIYNQNPPMAELSERVLKTIRDGRLPVASTNELQEFTFSFKVESRALPFRFVPARASTADFALWDGPGGSLFPLPEERGADFDHAAHARFRVELVSSLKSAEGVVLCLDATDRSRSLVMFESLPRIFGETGLREIPAKRICICLTKVDKRFSTHGKDALAEAEDSSALSCCRELLPRANFGLLRNYCPSAKVAFGWTSVYGFLPDGAPNYEPAEDRLVRRHGDGGDGKPEDEWRPFRVLDPFIWLAGGHHGSLEVVTGRDL
jgi:GTPase SAR1 family protein